MLLSLQHGPKHPQDMWQETTGCFPLCFSACFFTSQKGEQQGLAVPANRNECVEVAGGSACLISGDGYPFWSRERAGFSVSEMKSTFTATVKCCICTPYSATCWGRGPSAPLHPRTSWPLAFQWGQRGTGGPCATDPETGAQRGS